MPRTRRQSADAVPPRRPRWIAPRARHQAARWQRMTISTDALGSAMDDVGDTAMSRFRLLRPVIEDAVSVPALAGTSGVSVPTLRRWLRRYREHGVSGLSSRATRDRGGRHRVSKEMAAVIEGLALERPRRSVAAIHRIV